MEARYSAACGDSNQLSKLQACSAQSFSPILAPPSRRTPICSNCIQFPLQLFDKHLSVESTHLSTASLRYDPHFSITISSERLLGHRTYPWRKTMPWQTTTFV